MRRSKGIKNILVITVILFLSLFIKYVLTETEELESEDVCEMSIKEISVELPEVETEDTILMDTTLAVPYNVKISDMNDKGITIYWVTIEGMDGYQVYRAYEEGEWESLRDVGTGNFDVSHRTYTDSDFDADRREIFYSVRAYQYMDGRKVYSDYSESVAAEYRDKLKLEKKTIYMPVDTTRTLIAYYGWGNAQNVEWSSSDTEVLEIDENGTVYAHAKGIASVTCLAYEQNQTATMEIVVEREPEEPLSETVSRFQQNEDGIYYNTSSNNTQDAVIMMAGDMMCMGPQQRAAYSAEDGYNFNDSFSFVKSVMEQSDFAIGNLETMVATPYSYTTEEAYRGGKTIICNAPNRYLDAVCYGGFDAVALANNHNCDTEVEGIIYTIEQVDEYELMHTGLYCTKEDERTLLVDINGIKVGYLAYVSEHPGYNGKTARWDAEVIDTMLNYYSMDKAQMDIKILKERGAEYIIVYMHWGVKNNLLVADTQMQVAQELADIGVDYIVGAHSHTVQPYEEIVSSDGKSVPCIYSLGDFNTSTNQIDENRDSIVLRIRLIRSASGEIELIENNYIAFYTYTSYDNMSYVTIPIDTTLNGGLSDLENREENYARIRRCVGEKLEEYVTE